MENNEYTFTAQLVKKVYNNEDFYIYGVKVDKQKFPDIITNQYKTVTIKGNLFDLEKGVDYEIKATQEESKYGTCYNVLSCVRDVPASYQDMYKFLAEILTANQAKTLYENYPDIVDRVRQNRLDDIDFEKLHGIGEKSFEKIKRKIEDNYALADMMIAFDGYLSVSVLKKLKDEYGCVERVKSALSREPYKSLCSISGIGFKRADEILLSIEQASKENVAKGQPPIVDFGFNLRTSLDRCKSCVLYLLGQNELDGHTRMNLADLHGQCLRLVPECEHHFATAMENPAIYYDKQSMVAAFDRTHSAEQSIARQLIAALHMKTNHWGYNIEKYRVVNGASLSDEQMNTLANLCKYKVSILNGPGGTGKSFSAQAVIRMLKDHGLSFLLLSPTGKAAKVLSSYTREQASTIHRGLGYNPGSIEPWTYNCENKLSAAVVVVDEFSMVDVHLFCRLLDAIDFDKTRLLLIGDNAQLPSVSCGNLLHDFLETKLIPSTTLTNVFRYGDGGLMKVATDVRCCKPYLLNTMSGKRTSFGANQDYMFFDVEQVKIPDMVVRLYKTLMDAGNPISAIQVLVSQKKGDYGVDVLNNSIQSVANPNLTDENFMEIGSTKYYVGDPVIQMVNNYEAVVTNKEEFEDAMLDVLSDDEMKKHVQTAFVANGETGIIEAITPGNAIINFDGIKVCYKKEDMQHVSLGYAMTIHKSQGSSIDNVILVTPKAHTFMMNSNLLYVGLTRMRKRCYHIGSLRTVNQSVSKKANMKRNTFMQEMLVEYNNNIDKIYNAKKSLPIVNEDTVQESIDEIAKIQNEIDQYIDQYHDRYKQARVANNDDPNLSTNDESDDLPWYSDEELKRNKNFFGV